MLIKLPTQIISEVKRQKINGQLFGKLTEPQIMAIIKKEHKDVVCNPRYFRSLYTTVLDKWLKVDSKSILGKNFKSLDFI